MSIYGASELRLPPDGGNWHEAPSGRMSEVNVSEKRHHFRTDGQMAPLFSGDNRREEPLAAASKITAKGDRIVLDDAESDSYIGNKATGARISFRIENGVYMIEMLVEPPSFQRRAK